MSPVVSAEEVRSLALRLDNSLKTDDGYQIHLCVINGVVHYELAPVDYRLEEVVTEVLTVDRQGAIVHRSYKHMSKE